MTFYVRMSHSKEMLWSGWGDPAEATELGPETLELLRNALGVQARTPAVGRESLRPTASRLSDAAAGRLAAIAELRADDDARIAHTRGKSTPDLLRIRAGELTDAPDAVVLPATHEEVAELLRVCAEERIAVVPFGGGTSVVGGLAPQREGFAAVVALDLVRLDRLVELDEVSRIVDARARAARP